MLQISMEEKLSQNLALVQVLINAFEIFGSIHNWLLRTGEYQMCLLTLTNQPDEKEFQARDVQVLFGMGAFHSHSKATRKDTATHPSGRSRRETTPRFD